jgi:hypothetical protein
VEQQQLRVPAQTRCSRRVIDTRTTRTHSPRKRSLAPVDIRVGYYTSVAGLGRSPADVEIRNVICENGDFDFAGGALGNFWRSAENFKTKPTLVFNSEVRCMAREGLRCRCCAVCKLCSR